MYKNLWVRAYEEDANTWLYLTNTTIRGAAQQFARERDLDMPDNQLHELEEGLEVLVKDEDGEVTQVRVYSDLEPVYWAAIGPKDGT